MVDIPCPVCASRFAEPELAEHIATAHPTVDDPEIVDAKAHAEHACPFCERRFPTPERLKTHLATLHAR